MSPSIAAKPPEPAEVQAELDRILATDAFRRAERHTKFLSFVCETALRGNGSQLNEYLIAHEVFGRGADYSPGEDSVVRRQAHAVRQKLQEYYAGPGKDDPVRIVLPVGRYVPAFVRAEAEPVPEAPPPQPPVAAPPAPPAGRPRWHFALAAAVVPLLFAAGWLTATATRATPAGGLDPALQEIWSAWLSDPRGATFCFSNPLTAVVKQFSAPPPDSPIPPRIAMGPEEADHFRKWLNLPAGGFLYLSPAISQAKMGEAVGSVRLAAMLAAQQVPVHATQSRLLSWEDFRSANMILLGHDEANRWLDPILAKLPMRLGATDREKPRRIIDLQAKPGEASEYVIQYATKRDQPSQDFALISMLNGLDGKRQLLLVNGLNTEGTETALEYLSDAASTRALVAALRRVSPQHKGPWAFQAVLRTEVRDKVPTRTDLVVVRVL
jgi:hypothetical protein